MSNAEESVCLVNKRSVPVHVCLFCGFSDYKFNWFCEKHGSAWDEQKEKKPFQQKCAEFYSWFSEFEVFVFRLAVKQVREHHGVSDDEDDNVTDMCELWWFMVSSWSDAEIWKCHWLCVYQLATGTVINPSIHLSGCVVQKSALHQPGGLGLQHEQQ